MIDILNKDAGHHLYLKNVTLPQVFLKHFAKNQEPGLSVNGTLVENGLIW